MTKKNTRKEEKRESQTERKASQVNYEKRGVNKKEKKWTHHNIQDRKGTREADLESGESEERRGVQKMGKGKGKGETHKKAFWVYQSTLGSKIMHDKIIAETGGLFVPFGFLRVWMSWKIRESEGRCVLVEVLLYERGWMDGWGWGWTQIK